MEPIRNENELDLGQSYTIIIDRSRNFMESKTKDDDRRKRVHLMTIVKAKAVGRREKKYALFYYPNYSKYEVDSFRSLGLVKNRHGYHPTRKLVSSEKTPISIRLTEEEIKEKVKFHLSLDETAEIDILKS